MVFTWEWEVIGKRFCVIQGEKAQTIEQQDVENGFGSSLLHSRESLAYGYLVCPQKGFVVPLSPGDCQDQFLQVWPIYYGSFFVSHSFTLVQGWDRQQSQLIGDGILMIRSFIAHCGLAKVSHTNKTQLHVRYMYQQHSMRFWRGPQEHPFLLHFLYVNLCHHSKLNIKMGTQDIKSYFTPILSEQFYNYIL